MFTELSQDKFNAVRPLFETLFFNVEVPSILDGNTKGRVFVDSAENPSVAVMWDGLIGIFLAGDPNQEAFNRSLKEWFAEGPYPLAQSYHMDELAITFASTGWTAVLPALLNNYRLTLEPRRYFTHTGVPAMSHAMDANYAVVPVTADLLAREDLQHRGFLEGWVLAYWPSMERFINTGIGYVTLADNNAIASLCVSVFASGNVLEFGTATLPDHRNRGLSTAVAAACVNACLDGGREPIWHCWDTNAPSVAVAGKVGFQLERKYSIYKLWMPGGSE